MDPTQHLRALKGINARLNLFRDHANELFSTPGEAFNPNETGPRGEVGINAGLDADGVPWRLSTSQFRRTLAWHIAHQPFGIVAGSRQYQHAELTVFEGYAGTSASGFAAEVASEQAVAKLDYVEDLYRDWNDGKRSSGGATKRVDAEFERIRRDLGDLLGTVASPARLRTMLRHLTKTLHPGTLNDCFYQESTAACSSHAQRPGRPLPMLNTCSTCPNARRSTAPAHHRPRPSPRPAHPRQRPPPPPAHRTDRVRRNPHPTHRGDPGYRWRAAVGMTDSAAPTRGPTRRSVPAVAATGDDTGELIKSAFARLTRDQPALSDLDRTVMAAFERLMQGRPEVTDGTVTATNICLEAAVSRASYYRSPVVALIKNILAAPQTRRPELDQLHEEIKQLRQAERTLRRDHAAAIREFKDTIATYANHTQLLTLTNAELREENQRLSQHADKHSNVRVLHPTSPGDG